MAETTTCSRLAAPATDAGAQRGKRRRGLGVAAAVLFAACALLRLGLIDRHGLWADELFSLAMATGHSLEHPASAADATLGDFVEAPGPLPPSGYSRYLEHDTPPAGPSRVLRAVRLSDTSPPLYYLLLSAWTRAAGTSDAALRLFSVLFSLACFPVLWSLARRLGGPAAPVPTCALFSFSTVSVFYSTEGRMYSLMWFWVLAALWLALALRRRGSRPGLLALWVVVGAAGLLTHYFFVFVWAAAYLWLLLQPGRLPRLILAGAGAATVLLVLPWYARLPQYLSGWRVTGDWLNHPPGNYHPVLSLLYLPWSWFSIHGPWGGAFRWDAVNFAVFVALAAAVAWKGRLRSLFTPRRRLLWLCALGAWLGVVAFDQLRGTYAASVPRYAVGGMPAAFLLVGLALARLRPFARLGFLGLILLICAVGVSRVYLNPSRNWEPTRQLGALLAADAQESDVVIVHSIPSNVTGVARAAARHGAEGRGLTVASWVGQLKQRRVPQDIRALVAGRRRVIFVNIHAVGEPAPEEAWLRENARLVRHVEDEAAEVSWFVPPEGETFPPPGGGVVDRQNGVDP